MPDLSSNTVFSIRNGWLKPAKSLPSPNFNDRPEGASINLLVLHNISLPPEQFGGAYIQDFFCNCLEIQRHPYFEKIKSLKVSSHLLITRKGEVVQFVAFDKRAWHAGKSMFDGRENCNDFSIGIELEGSDYIPYTALQYSILASVCKALIKTYPGLEKKTIVGHCDIAPGRKTDPGPHFSWERLNKLLLQP